MYDLLKQRRSIRKFKKDAVEKEKLDTLLKSALLSPSSRAKRPWEFIAVTDKELLQKLSQSKKHGSQFLADAPLGIVVIADAEECDVWTEDASIASTIIQLTAQSLGLGSCWIQIRRRYLTDEIKSGDYIKEILNIPSKYGIECIIAIGYPDETKRAYEEEELLYSKLHYDRF